MREAAREFMGVQQPIEHHHHYEVQAALPDVLPAKMFELHFGITPAAINGKIASGTWTEGDQFVYDPQGRIHVILEGYYEWVKSGKSKRRVLQKVSASEAANAQSISDGTANGIEKQPTSNQRKQGSKLQPVFDQRL